LSKENLGYLQIFPAYFGGSGGAFVEKPPFGIAIAGHHKM
jgi:hypothetical protein